MTIEFVIIGSILLIIAFYLGRWRSVALGMINEEIKHPEFDFKWERSTLWGKGAIVQISSWIIVAILSIIGANLFSVAIGTLTTPKVGMFFWGGIIALRWFASSWSAAGIVTNRVIKAGFWA